LTALDRQEPQHRAAIDINDTQPTAGAHLACVPTQRGKLPGGMLNCCDDWYGQTGNNVGAVRVVLPLSLTAP
jgi:hypothetical protein